MAKKDWDRQYHDQAESEGEQADIDRRKAQLIARQAEDGGPERQHDLEPTKARTVTEQKKLDNLIAMQRREEGMQTNRSRSTSRRDRRKRIQKAMQDGKYMHTSSLEGIEEADASMELHSQRPFERIGPDSTSMDGPVTHARAMRLLGRVPGAKGLWLAAAIWITHAAGSARLLARVMRGREGDGEMARALDPARFADGNKKGLEALALRQYNDIYRSELAK